MSESMLEWVKARIKSAYDKECGELGTTMDDATALWLARAAVKAMRPDISKMELIRRIAADMDMAPGLLDIAICQYIDAALSDKP
jgi:molybdopterin-biosynthesis enzyme MoeA-like protein